jgi:alkaline phosphatase D
MAALQTPFGRRSFLVGAAATAALVRMGWSFRPAGAGLQPGNPFTLGVASGDPLPDRVMLWTRLAIDPIDVNATPSDSVDVNWTVYADDSLGDVVASGTAQAEASFAHSVHVDVTGLEPDTWYWYQFDTDGYESLVGRTRTAPAAGCSVDQVRFGFASCQNWTAGFYPAHHHLAAEEIDLVFFLGDYIYEGGGTGPVRAHNSDEVMTLEAYRNRYGLYKSDPNLQESHARCPWFVIWDDHEVENNYAGEFPENASPSPEFLLRRAAAYRAWWEHMPVRLPVPEGPDLTIYRSFEWGGLASMFLVDGRQYRNNQACGVEDLSAPCPEWEDPTRSMLGSEQEAWLLGALRSTSSTWNVIANQTVFSSLPLVGNWNMDQWDGYPGSRQRILDVFAEGVPNPVVITGDIHSAGVADITQDWDDPTKPVLGTELVGTSISSSFPAELVDVAEDLIAGLPWVRYVNARQRGYSVVDLNGDRMEATYRVVDDVTDPDSGVSTAFVYTVDATATGAACLPGTIDEPGSTGASPNQAVSPQFTG